MAIINFDQAQRRDNREPQTTKKELLQPPPRIAYGDDWSMPLGASGFSDLASQNDSWSFEALNTVETSPRGASIPVKHESSPLESLTGSKKRTPDNDITQEPDSKKARSNHISSAQDAAGSASHNSFGGVVDLTGDDSDNDQDFVMPERQFVPRAEDDNQANHFQRRKAPTPPRTYTTGLPPVAPHPKQPPLMARSKPPIKPLSNRQSTVSALPARGSHSVFSRTPRATPSVTDDLHLSRQQTASLPVGSLKCASLCETTDIAEQTPLASGTFSPANQKKASGPFLEEDSSGDEDHDDEDDPASKNDRNRQSDSLARLVDRPRNDTPARAKNDSLVEKNNQMRQQARERATTVAPSKDLTSTTSPSRAYGSQPFLGLPHQREMQ